MATKKTPEYLKPTTDGAHVDITLRRQYMFDNVPVSTLRMREPTVRDQLATSEMTGSDARKEIATIANLCEVTPANIESLAMADYLRLQAAYTSFLN